MPLFQDQQDRIRILREEGDKRRKRRQELERTLAGGNPESWKDRVPAAVKFGIPGDSSSDDERPTRMKSNFNASETFP